MPTGAGRAAASNKAVESGSASIGGSWTQPRIGAGPALGPLLEAGTIDN